MNKKSLISLIVLLLSLGSLGVEHVRLRQNYDSIHGSFYKLVTSCDELAAVNETLLKQCDEFKDMANSNYVSAMFYKSLWTECTKSKEH